MKRIDFLPDELAFTWTKRILYRVDRQFVPTLIRSVLGVLIFFVGVMVIQLLLIQSYGVRTDGLRAKQRKVEVELKGLEVTVGRLDEREGQLRRQVAWQEKRFEYLRAYQKTDDRWASILDEIKRAVPYGVWLTELEGDPDKKLRLAGGAFEEDLVIQFMGDLKVIPRFRNVAFNFTKKGRIGKTSIVQFEVTCSVTPS